ncbi:hypothetical protein A3I27_04715 [Candidatus Giovannonibacteria bacterium RIFCSPLOWO2_02_FULL_43_11b]|uniref:DUF4015 domain-containing protein n=1 Tax=Candidatus Giovannonibacteria bacterium RIFCSPHIGHO2_12_FULL_43_15 TaxID=1798341 RepID=A0A1F5WSF8_9BACT|nr:MAG: hypothetical protein A2739_03085 [Candidatus Giovannonibacteria bacterium RIFCSPHIGHO2_01_FULL_43_100]OGF67268.1 MAG: hypothetical protein A3B97_00450 [Candidatus Giovannonibacteria bacterium RIFCSPHIGHO2_02_FULL_43_32]OGF78261.1 MAG: hypothetical protein A3F23_02410 [Candidatus Giovannonibacteria bacterium RIFCSPHIGHO2_12_FULL_43_15]OGF78766.1 MAG: hypothetical protein A3A15_00900 [Candidatus Giovannonibacteria bacterium RIFCSPLOWO2_01_FULL_43_60]OGF90328.1 MAG: hypothetical protein A3
MKFFSLSVFIGAVLISLFFISRAFEPVEYISERLGLDKEKKKAEVQKVQHLPTPEAVRGIYMTSWVSGTKDWRADMVNFIDKTEINSIVIDVKDYSGRVSFDTGDEKIKEIGSEEIRIKDLTAFIEDLHKKSIYTIARITVFQDPFYSKKYPESSVKTKSGAIWKDRKGLSYIDPFARDYWDYMVLLSRASEKVGFDELNYDYIRFPSDGNMSDAVFPLSGNTNKADVLDSFFSYLRGELKNGKDPISIPMSADIFGMTTTNTDDLGIGQVLERIDKHFDYISPMVYPSHYPPTFQGYKNPAEHPYEIIKFAMDAAFLRLSAPTSTPAKLRPWIQDFDLGAKYDAAMVRAQKKAVYDSGLSSWLSWDPANKYTRGAYDLKE